MFNQAILDQISIARKGKILVFTNGVFDILHVGHVRYLQQAKALGDVLVVGLNSDSSTKQLGKGEDRPINTEDNRQEVLLALESVDFVVIFEDTDPRNIISVLRPDIHTKGGDYRAQELIETPIVESYGGQVVILPFSEGISTTSILKKLSSD